MYSTSTHPNEVALRVLETTTPLHIVIPHARDDHRWVYALELASLKLYDSIMSLKPISSILESGLHNSEPHSILEIDIYINGISHAPQIFSLSCEYTLTTATPPIEVANMLPNSIYDEVDITSPLQLARSLGRLWGSCLS